MQFHACGDGHAGARKAAVIVGKDLGGGTVVLVITVSACVSAVRVFMVRGRR